MDGIALRACPGRARPHRRFALAIHFFCDLENSLVVEKWEEIVNRFACDAFVDGVRFCAFTEIDLDRSHALFEQSPNFSCTQATASGFV